MQYTTLGHSGIKVSKLCLGGMSFGEPSPDFHQWTIGPDDTRAVIKRALDTGINFIDTANCYSFGTSEEYICAALRNLGIARESVVLASKVHFNEGGLSADAIKREIEGSLKRLGTDYLDLYIIHRFDYDVPMEETMEALDDLVREGKVRALGASAMYAYQLHNLQIVARDHGWAPFTSMQCHYNLLYREDEREMIPVCRQFDMALTPYSPLRRDTSAAPRGKARAHVAPPTRPWPTSTTMIAPSTCPSLSAWPRLPPIMTCRWRRLRWHGTGHVASRPPSWAAPSPSASTTPWPRST